MSILPINTMRYGTDTFSFRKQAMIISKAALNATGATDVEGFNIAGAQPEDCDRRLIFKIDDVWYKLTGDASAALAEVATQSPTIDSVLEEGNTVADIMTITAIPAFVGKQIYPAIALDAPPDATVMPSLKLELKTRNNRDQFQKDELSAEYELADQDVDIVSVTPDITTTGQATAAVAVSLKQAGTWSGWMDTLAAKGQKGSAIKYKATYTVSTLDGSDTAKVNKVNCIYCNGNAYVSGNTAEILTITADYENPLAYVRCLVRHKKLMDAQIRAYVSFRDKPKFRNMLNIGTGNNERQLIQLKDTGINHNTLQVFYDTKPAYNYDYNTELSQLLCVAPEGASITASYSYGWEKEEWRQMQLQGIQKCIDSADYESNFSYELPSVVDNKSISVVKIELYRPEGKVENETLGIATGQKQVFVLPHFAKKETIVCTGAFSYDDNSRIFTVVADKGTAIQISYTWSAETHEVSGLVAAWNE